MGHRDIFGGIGYLLSEFERRYGPSRTRGLGSATCCRGWTGGRTGGRTTPNPPHYCACSSAYSLSNNAASPHHHNWTNYIADKGTTLERPIALAKHFAETRRLGLHRDGS